MGPFVVLRRIAVPFQEFAMKKLVAAGLLLAFTNTIASDSSLLDQEFRYLASEETVNLGKEFQGKVLLIVNTASKCGNTPQYEGLEKLYEEYGDRGLVVLGFPSNDFLGQEPGTEEEIQEFCRLTYKVRYPSDLEFPQVPYRAGRQADHGIQPAHQALRSEGCREDRGGAGLLRLRRRTGV